MTYYKFRVEGWVEMDSKVYEKHGIALSKLAYEMDQGNGICSSFETIKITESFEDLDGGAENFFVDPLE